MANTSRFSVRLARTVLFAIPLVLAASVGAQQQPPGVPVGAVRVRGRPGTGATAREVAVVVENTGATPVSLRAGVVLQRLEGGHWQNSSAAGLLLRTACDGPPLPSCVTLAARATVTTAPWTGMWGDAQCDCTRCGPAPAGTYRFVVSTCAGAAIEGTPFQLPAN